MIFLYPETFTNLMVLRQMLHITQCIFDALSVKVDRRSSEEILSKFHGYDGYSCLWLLQTNDEYD